MDASTAHRAFPRQENERGGGIVRLYSNKLTFLDATRRLRAATSTVRAILETAPFPDEDGNAKQAAAFIWEAALWLEEVAKQHGAKPRPCGRSRG